MRSEKKLSQDFREGVTNYISQRARIFQYIQIKLNFTNWNILAIIIWYLFWNRIGRLYGPDLARGLPVNAHYSL